MRGDARGARLHPTLVHRFLKSSEILKTPFVKQSILTPLGLHLRPVKIPPSFSPGYTPPLKAILARCEVDPLARKKWNISTPLSILAKKLWKGDFNPSVHPWDSSGKPVDFLNHPQSLLLYSPKAQSQSPLFLPFFHILSTGKNDRFFQKLCPSRGFFHTFSHLFYLITIPLL
jgi:hypothetical protein